MRLPTTLCNKLTKIAGERPFTSCYLNNEKVKGVFNTGSVESFWGKKGLVKCRPLYRPFC